MTTNKTEEIREEWKKYVISTLPEPLEDGEKVLALSVDFKEAENWWIKKLEEQKQEMVEEVEKLRISKTNCDPGGKIGNPFNKALDTVLSIIKKIK